MTDRLAVQETKQFARHCKAHEKYWGTVIPYAAVHVKGDRPSADLEHACWSRREENVLERSGVAALIAEIQAVSWAHPARLERAVKLRQAALGNMRKERKHG